MTIFYVRHGESTVNILDGEKNTLVDPVLTERGYRQASTTAEELLRIISNTPHESLLIITSNLTRTKLTAKYLLDLLDQNNISYSHENLAIIREYIPLHKEITPEQYEQNIRHDSSWSEFLKRVKKFSGYLKTHGLIIVFSHELFLSSLLNYQIVQEKYMGNQHISISLPNCSITRLNYLNVEDYIWKIDYIGYISHLNRSD